MPCCIGIIRYAWCRHRTLFKLGCTDKCEGLCPLAKQEVMLYTRFRWQCEDCHGRRHGADAELRMEHWSDQAERIIAEDGKQACRYRLLNLRDQEEFIEQMLEQQRLKQVEEIQQAEQWTSDYGQTAFMLRYGVQERPAPSAQQSRRSDQEQEAQHIAAENEKVLSPGPSDNDDDSLDGKTEAQISADELRRNIQVLRSQQQPDLLVLRDTLRSNRELREQQESGRRLARLTQDGSRRRRGGGGGSGSGNNESGAMDSLIGNPLGDARA
ncbi:hypothetical protein HIM_09166 [Hirsutella minnesotensis 3608]|uniref:Uncharacterized protein n=1 Tax=Hirsutella minnesotensis 3608 TaxID=1043627 RepID=A0A0F7ZXW7_9HYPO|nr:hypothetical protein HIM_09166 [Hirsutella minnesotensis 3608]